jgi:hypothetical protein
MLTPTVASSSVGVRYRLAAPSRRAAGRVLEHDSRLRKFVADAIRFGRSPCACAHRCAGDQLIDFRICSAADAPSAASAWAGFAFCSQLSSASSLQEAEYALPGRAAPPRAQSGLLLLAIGVREIKCARETLELGERERRVEVIIHRRREGARVLARARLLIRRPARAERYRSR